MQSNTIIHNYPYSTNTEFQASQSEPTITSFSSSCFTTILYENVKGKTLSYSAILYWSPLIKQPAITPESVEWRILDITPQEFLDLTNSRKSCDDEDKRSDNSSDDKYDQLKYNDVSDVEKKLFQKRVHDLSPEQLLLSREHHTAAYPGFIEPEVSLTGNRLMVRSRFQSNRTEPKPQYYATFTRILGDDEGDNEESLPHRGAKDHSGAKDHPGAIEFTSTPPTTTFKESFIETLNGHANEVVGILNNIADRIIDPFSQNRQTSSSAQECSQSCSAKTSEANPREYKFSEKKSLDLYYQEIQIPTRAPRSPALSTIRKRICGY